MITLIIEALFAVVFLHSLSTYLRHRGPVQRDLTLAFAPVALFLVVQAVTHTAGAEAVPVGVAYAVTTLLLAQPYLTMRLVRTVRPVPWWLMRVVLGVVVATVVPVFVMGQRLPAVGTLLVVTGFFAVQALAAVLLAREARYRRGAPRARMFLAAVATAGLGLCLLLTGASGSVGDAGRAARSTSEAFALLSGLGYAVAFLPPRWLRRTWAGGAAYRVHHRMADAPADEPPNQVWRRYASTVRDVSGAAGAVVLLPVAGVVACVAISGDAPDRNLITTDADLDRQLTRRQPIAVPARTESALLSYAARAGAHAAVVVPLPLPSSGRGALLLLSRRYPMFVDDDARLLGELGAWAAILAERGAAAEAIRALNAELEQRVRERTTELRAAQAALEARNALLIRSNEELQRFAFVASHDLQEPLRKLISFSGLLAERVPGDDPDVRMYLDRITGSAARMKRLIEDLLTLSRAAAVTEASPVDCEAALVSTLESLAAVVAETGASVTHDPLPVVLASRASVERVLQHLIGNALKYRSEAPPRVHVSAEERGDGWRITVADNGIGIDMAYANRIFQVFQRLHPRGRYEGTGLGLALCKRIVETHGGDIGVDSIPGAGSTFWFTLPAAPRWRTQEVPHALARAAG